MEERTDEVRHGPEVSRDAAMIRLNAPASLGTPYHPDS